MGIPDLIFFCVLVLAVFSNVFVNGEGGIFKVRHKFGSEANRSLKDLTVHDKNRHGRLLAAIDIPLAGDGKATGTGLYYTKLAIGSPPKDYFLHVDTGSDILWVNCVQCYPCPAYTEVDDLTLKLYDPKHSSTAGLVPCSGGLCTGFYKGFIPSCLSDDVCPYGIQYGDGSGSIGYFVNDVIGFDQVFENLQTTAGNSSITFGCGVRQTGNLASSTGALDGLIGFGASSISMLTQLASSGKMKKKFAHCLYGKNGGGIFVIGDVLLPTLETTPLVPDATHYNVNMESVQVSNTVLNIPKQVFEAGKGTIIDSGTTLAYLPAAIFDPLRRMKNEWCSGWQDTGKLKSDAVKDLIILGGNAHVYPPYLVLTNKLVLYDLENQVLGFSDYNCSSTIRLKAEVSGDVNQEGSHSLSSSHARYHMDFGRVIKLLLLSFVLYNCV